MIALFLTFANTALFAVNADLVLKPRDTEAVVGDSTYFDCASNVNRNEISWYHYAVGAKDHEDICIYCLGSVHPQYENRIQIERNISNSRLRINSVQLKDAGIYICQDNGGIGDSTSAQLVVLDSSPICTSNIQPDGVLGPNSCNIEPDELHLSCNVSYNGNIPPKIQWREIRTVDPVDKGFSCQHIGNLVSCNLRMNADLRLHGASYICETNRSATTQYNCTSDIIRIIYAKTDDSKEETIQDSAEKFNCSANSSQTCSYLWKWFDGVDEEVVSSNSVLTPWKIGWHKCEANCTIRGNQCTVLSRLVHVSEAKTISNHVILESSLGICLAMMVILPVLTFCMIRRRGLRKKVRSRTRQRFLTYKSKTNTNQLEMIRHISSVANEKPIYGLSILGKKIYVVRQSSARVEVYDAITLVLKSELKLEEKTDPWDIASCNKNRCLYIVDCTAPEILGVNPDANGSIFNKWSTGNCYGLLSVTPEANILLAVQFRNKINEYSPEGQVVRIMQLLELSILNLRHAIKLANKRYMISFGCMAESPQGVIVLDGETLIASSVTSKEHQSQLNIPMQMCVHSSGFILVLDAGNSRVLQFDSALEFQKELISSKHGLCCPMRICLEESNCILFVANNSFDFDTPELKGEILAFKIT